MNRDYYYFCYIFKNGKNIIDIAWDSNDKRTKNNSEKDHY